MNGVDADELESLAHINGGEHSSVGRRFLSIGLHLHTTGDTAVGLTAGQISHVEESVVEGGHNVAHGEHVLSVLGVGGSGGTVVGNLLFLDCLLVLLLGGLQNGKYKFD